jgi:hypothetical protein
VEEARLLYASFFRKRNNILVGRIFGNLVLCACVCVCVQLLVVSLGYYDGKGPLCVR